MALIVNLVDHPDSDMLYDLVALHLAYSSSSFEETCKVMVLLPPLHSVSRQMCHSNTVIMHFGLSLQHM